MVGTAKPKNITLNDNDMEGTIILYGQHTVVVAQDKLKTRFIQAMSEMATIVTDRNIESVCSQARQMTLFEAESTVYIVDADKVNFMSRNELYLACQARSCRLVQVTSNEAAPNFGAWLFNLAYLTKISPEDSSRNIYNLRYVR